MEMRLATLFIHRTDNSKYLLLLTFGQHSSNLLYWENKITITEVVCFTVLVLGAEQLDCRIQQFQHFVAGLNVLGVMLNIAARRIGAGQVDRIRKILDGSAILALKF